MPSNAHSLRQHVLILVAIFEPAPLPYPLTFACAPFASFVVRTGVSILVVAAHAGAATIKAV